MVINLRRYRRTSADERGLVWRVGRYRKDTKSAQRYRCFLNGKEITNQTFYCDSRRGIVRVYKLNDKGNKYIDPVTGGVAWQELRGRVRLHRKRAEAA